MQPPGLEVVEDPEAHLGGVERLGEEIRRARAERVVTGFRGRVRGQDESREELAFTAQLPDHGEQSDSVDVRHVKVEQHDVRLLLDEDLAELRGDL